MRVVAVLVATCLIGCGLTMTRGPEGTPPGQRPNCTETFAAPKQDAIIAVLGFVTILTGILFYKEDKEDLGTGLIVGGAVAMAGAYASGGIGYYRVKRCQKAIRAFGG
jgi:hypothetical protein